MRQVRDLVRSLLKGREPVAKEAEPPTVEPEPFVSPIEVTPVGRPMRIFVVGDSHSLPMRDLLVRESLTGRDYLVVGKYITGFTAAGMMQDGELSAELVAALEGEHLLRNGRFSLGSMEQADLAASHAAGVPGSPPLLVITAGDIDLRGDFLNQLRDEYDIVLPFATPYGTNAGARIMPYDVALRRATAAFQPLTDAIVKLRELGLIRVLVLALAPPSLDQGRFDTLHGFTCPLDTRYKATVLFNRVLAESCAKAGARFVDVWPDVIDGRGYMRPEYELDGVHMNCKAALLSMRRVLSQAILDSYACVNRNRYELALSLIAKEAPGQVTAEVEAAAAEYHATGICRTAIAPEAAQSIVDALQFDHDVGNRHARLDWFGTGVEPFSSHIRAAEPEQSALDLLYEQLYQPRIAALMQRCIGGDVWYLGCRAFQSLPHGDEGTGPQSYHHDGCPPGVFRAIIYLVDVDDDNGPFEYLDEGGQQPHKVLGPKGTMFIFDANRLMHRATPPRGRLRRSVDFVIVPRTPHQPRCVLWSGVNAWPGDPFHFSINGMRSSPAGLPDIVETNPLTG